MSVENPGGAVALAEWAVTCDALARGEQILLLRDDDGSEREGGASALPSETFWLCPRTGGPDPTEVADPYRDRIRALESLGRDDGQLRLQYAAAAEHVERIGDRDRLMALDGQHTLNRSAVDRRLDDAGSEGLLFVVLRVYGRESALLVDETGEARAGRGWIRLPDGEDAAAALDRRSLEEDMDPVLPDGRFLERKAELLQLSGSMQAM